MAWKKFITEKNNEMRSPFAGIANLLTGKKGQKAHVITLSRNGPLPLLLFSQKLIEYENYSCLSGKIIVISSIESIEKHGKRERQGGFCLYWKEKTLATDCFPVMA
ncbi:MAG: hypothetical protein OEV42_10815 [Deltaproteobacteria bacterium]|nr:hypothetical protein [Deltaproteobacteria bacterium]